MTFWCPPARSRLCARAPSLCLSARLNANGPRGTQGGHLQGNGGEYYSEEETSAAEEDESLERRGEEAEDVDDEEGEVSSASSSGSSIFEEEPAMWGTQKSSRRRVGKAAMSRQKALEFVLCEVVRNGGMMELYKLGALLNQKHPEMKKKVGKLRAFLEKHRQHLRVIRNQDVNGSPDDFVMLTDRAIGHAYASSNGGSKASGASISRGQKKRSKSKASWDSSPLSKLHGKSRKEGDPCNYQWDDLSSSEMTYRRTPSKKGRRSGGGWARGGGGGDGGGGASYRATRRGLQRALATRNFDSSSESDLPIGVL